MSLAGATFLTISAYLTYLWKNIPTTGTLFITENFMCFTSPFKKKNVVLAFSEITKLEKKAYRTTESIEVHLQNGKHYYFNSLNKTEEIYSIVTQIWESTIKKIWKSAEATLDEVESHYAYQNPQWSNSSANDTNKSSGNVNAMLTGTDQQRTVDKAKNKSFQMTFRMPSDEYILKGNTGL